MPSFILQRCLVLLPRLLAGWLMVAIVLEIAMLGPRWRGEAAGGQTPLLFQELVAGDLPETLATSYGERQAPGRWWQAVGEGAWASLLAFSMAVGCMLAFGSVLGVSIARLRRWRWIRGAVAPLQAIGWMPGFWFVLLAVWWMVMRWEQPGYANSAPATGGPAGLERFWQATLVAVPVALIGVGWQIRVIPEVLMRRGRDAHVRGAYSRGVSGGALFYRHLLGNSLGPLIRSVDVILPAMLGMQIVIEWALKYPGLGRLSVDSARAAQFTGLFGAGLVFSVVLVFSRWLGESLAEWLDPGSA